MSDTTNITRSWKTEWFDREMLSFLKCFLTDKRYMQESVCAHFCLYERETVREKESDEGVHVQDTHVKFKHKELLHHLI